METPLAAEELNKHWARKNACEQRIVALAKTLVPVLKDAGRPHSAAELEVLFFELEANEQEIEARIKADPAAFFEEILRRLGQRRR